MIDLLTDAEIERLENKLKDDDSAVKKAINEKYKYYKANIDKVKLYLPDLREYCRIKKKEFPI